MPHVLRWGQSAYETAADLALERDASTALGLTWDAVGELTDPPLVGVDALVVTSRVRVDRALLDRFSGSLVLTTTSGTDHIDVAHAEARGIRVARCPLARRDAVAEQAVLGIIGLLRRLPSQLRSAEQGRWARAELPALDPIGLRGATVLVVGLGVIGAQVARLLEPTGAKLLGVDPRGVPPGVPPLIRAAALDDVLPSADAVTLHCTLDERTRGLFDAERIARMRPGGVLVNTARGALVDADAAVRAVSSGHLRGLMLDVFPEEPWPGLGAAAQVDGVWLTPHASGFSRGLGARVAQEVGDTLAAWVAGRELPHWVRKTEG